MITITESAKMEILKALAFGDLGRAREIQLVCETMEDQIARGIQRKDMYFWDDSGNEYRYDRDGKRHYTKMEG